MLLRNLLYLQFHAFADLIFEARHLRFHAVNVWLQRREGVIAVAVRGSLACEVCVRVWLRWRRFPLRERAGDIPLLVDHFLRTSNCRHGKSIERIPDDVIKAFIRYNWPGNIRELQNFVERSVILTKGEAELRAPVSELINRGIGIRGVRTLADADRDHIISTLRETKWVVGGPNGAATRLGLNRTTLIAKMRKLGISRETAEKSAQQLGSYTKATSSSLPALA